MISIRLINPITAEAATTQRLGRPQQYGKKSHPTAKSAEHHRWRRPRPSFQHPEEKRNARSLTMWQGSGIALIDCAMIPMVCVVSGLVGRGGKAFCFGRGWRQPVRAENPATTPRRGRVFETQRQERALLGGYPKPTIACIAASSWRRHAGSAIAGDIRHFSPPRTASRHSRGKTASP